MKHSFVNSFFILFLLHMSYTSVCKAASILRRQVPYGAARTTNIRNVVPLQQQRFSFKTFPQGNKATVPNRFSQSIASNRFASWLRNTQQWWSDKTEKTRQWIAQRLSQLRYGKMDQNIKIQQALKKEKDLINKIANGPSAIESFLTFVKQNDGPTIDGVLDQLIILENPAITSEAGIEFLESVINFVCLSEKLDVPVLEKLASWTTFRYKELLKKEKTTDVADIFMYLIGAEYLAEIEKEKLSSTILENIEQVATTKVGLELIKKLHEDGMHLKYGKNELTGKEFNRNKKNLGKHMLKIWDEIKAKLNKTITE